MSQHPPLSDFTEPAQTPARHAAAQRVTWVSVGVNIVLSIIQIATGIFAHAQSLVADGFHSLSDLIADFLVLLANRHSRQPADADHPYGHERIETVASLALGLILAATGLAILWGGAQRLQHLDDLPEVHGIAFWVALGTLIAKELLFRYMLKVGEKFRSPMLISNAWHARADAASSLVVAAGIGGSLLGWRFLDPVAAVLVGFMILRMGVSFGWEALRELVDTAIPEDEQAAVRLTIKNTTGVLSAHAIRTRRMAHKVLVDAHIQVEPRISVSEGHRVAEAVRQAVLGKHPDVLEVLVHVDIDPHGEDNLAPMSLLGREAATLYLNELLRQKINTNDLTLHYLSSGLEAIIDLPDSKISDDELVQLRTQLITGEEKISPFVRISLRSKIGEIDVFPVKPAAKP